MNVKVLFSDILKRHCKLGEDSVECSMDSDWVPRDLSPSVCRVENNLCRVENNLCIECRLDIRQQKWKPKRTYVLGYNLFWEYFLEAVARVERLKLKMCFTLLVLPGFMKIYIEGTHVSAHMYICPDFRLIFYHDPCYYPVCSLVLFLCYPRRRYIFYLLCVFVLTISFLMLGSF